MSVQRVLVTGSGGFIGRAVVKHLVGRGEVHVRAASRKGRPVPFSHEYFESPNLSNNADWRGGLLNIDAVVHTAARVHMMKDSSLDPLAEFRRVNKEGSLALARQAAEAGVRRFVFISSVKVNGESTVSGRPYVASDQPKPTDAYGISKHEAEMALLKLAQDTDMDVTIIRPVLVYGPGVEANFRRLMVWLDRGLPLPLGDINNRRSLVSVANLVDLISVCLIHPAAANQVFMVSDGDDMSTTELLRRLGRLLDAPDRLFALPEKWLRLCLRFLGRNDVSHRLFESLQVDISDTCKTLDWKPPVPVDLALSETVSEFLTQKSTEKKCG